MSDDTHVAVNRGPKPGAAERLEAVASGLRAAAGDATVEAAALDAVAALREPEPELRALALREVCGLGVFLTYRLAALELGLEDEAVLVRRAAATAVEHLGAELSHAFHRGHDDLVVRVLHMLVRGLRDEDPGVRERTASAFVTLDLDLARRSRTGTIASIPTTALDEPPRKATDGLVRRALRTHHAALGLRPPEAVLAEHELETGTPDRVERLWLLVERIADRLGDPRHERELELALRALAGLAPLALTGVASLGLPAATRTLSALGADTLPEHFVDALVERLVSARPELQRTTRAACHALARRGTLPKRLQSALERASDATPRHVTHIGG